MKKTKTNNSHAIMAYIDYQERGLLRVAMCLCVIEWVRKLQNTNAHYKMHVLNAIILHCE